MIPETGDVRTAGALEQPETKVLALFVETVRDPEAFAGARVALATTGNAVDGTALADIALRWREAVEPGAERRGAA